MKGNGGGGDFLNFPCHLLPGNLLVKLCWMSNHNISTEAETDNPLTHIFHFQELIAHQHEFQPFSMIAILSPAKTLDFETPVPNAPEPTQPLFLDQSTLLVETLRKKTPRQLSKLMDISEQLAQLNHQRFQDWHTPFRLENARSCGLAFKGDVYLGLQAESLSIEQLLYSQDHLRILSGLHGLLRPLDLIQPYRLEMGTELKFRRKKNLYDFWGDQLTQQLNVDIAQVSAPALVNLASNEYSSALQLKKIDCPIISPVFHDEKNGTYKMISFFAKKARGLMARYLILNEISNPEEIKGFNMEGYSYHEDSSTPDKPVFRRPENWK
jgi:cytoplasmic iron level regulating protein YaaA (DUF328/UPF0246 family)